MSKLFIKLSILVFVFSIFSLQNLFAQFTTNTCSQTSATYSKSVVTADHLKMDNYKVCVNDDDTGQTVTVTSSRGSIDGAAVSSGGLKTVYYSDTFLVSDIGTSKYINFTANDGFISSSIATLTVNFTIASITATINGTSINSGTTVGENYDAGESKTVACTNSTYINVNGSDVVTGSDANGYNISYTFTTSASVAKYEIKCGNVAG